jgi:hypothetical protein
MSRSHHIAAARAARQRQQDTARAAGAAPPHFPHPRPTPREAEKAADWEREPRWPAIVAGFATAGLYAALPESLSLGPRWMVPVIVLALMVPTVVAHRLCNHRVNTVLGFSITGVLTTFMVWSLALLVLALPTHKETPGALLRSAFLLWVANVLVFALWYWRIDSGGPHGRDLRRWHNAGVHHHTGAAFLFPQMAMAGDEGTDWMPQFMDYLFLSFNTSTALSPTDTAVLSRRAKALMMVQSGISLTVIVLLAARAVNIL